jgi:hypothetical protein
MKNATPDQGEQRSLFSNEELAALKHPATSLPSTGGKAPLYETREVRKARRSKGSANQLKLPGL